MSSKVQKVASRIRYYARNYGYDVSNVVNIDEVIEMVELEFGTNLTAEQRKEVADLLMKRKAS